MSRHYSVHREQHLFWFCHLLAIVGARKEMPINVRCDHDAGMPHALLHRLDGQLEAAVLSAVDAVRRVEVPQSMQARIFGFALGIHNPGLRQCWLQEVLNDMDVIPKLAFSVRENEVEIALRANQFPFAQRVHDIGTDREG
jgi:hypothetical protein